ncbi:MAG: hypothetical protein V3T90_12905, partial [Anaerolineae bacterium]
MPFAGHDGEHVLAIRSGDGLCPAGRAGPPGGDRDVCHARAAFVSHSARDGRVPLQERQRPQVVDGVGRHLDRFDYRPPPCRLARVVGGDPDVIATVR